MDGRENYLDYVANRPGVKALGEHGLWDAHGKVPSLENAVAEVARHTGNVWTPVISLSRENAERLGYTDLKNWQELINASITDIAKGYKIHPDRLRWYAAMHEKEKHIHVHMVLFSTDPKEGYLSRQGIRSIKSALVSTIYRNDRLHIYEQKDEQRGLLRQEGGMHGWQRSLSRWQPVLCKAIRLYCQKVLRLQAYLRYRPAQPHPLGRQQSADAHQPLYGHRQKTTG